jgi:hypothetical protein
MGLEYVLNKTCGRKPLHKCASAFGAIFGGCEGRLSVSR